MFHLIYLIPVLLSLSFINSQTCTTVVRRPEIRELTSTQLQTFINAVLQLNNTANANFYTTSSSTHYNNVPAAHGVPAFLPWHRVFLRRYEQALQRINPSIVLPYWDWSRDSQSPERSIVFTSNYFGGNGRSGDYCVNNGPFRQFRVSVPNNHCLRRNFNGGTTIGSFYSPASLESILTRSTTFDSLRQAIEGGPHGTVHVNIGGNNGDMSYMYSPNDPLFYMHHAFVDMLWYEWQQRYPTLANTYNGRAGSRTVSSSDTLTPFGVTVQSTFNTRSGGYCYYYNRYSGSTQSSMVASALSSTQTNSLRRRQTGANSLSLAASSNSAEFNNLKNRIESIVKGSFANSAQSQIDAFDRTTYGKIRTPRPLPDSYIRANNLDMNRVRKDEQEIATFIRVLNSMPDFRPEADLL